MRYSYIPELAKINDIMTQPVADSQVDRLIRLSRRHTLTATILGNIPADALDATITGLEKYSIRGREVACIYSHLCDGDVAKFVEYIEKLAARPTGCPANCEWPRPKPDETHIFGPKRKESEYMCVMADCESEAPWACSKCYVVRYCSPMCQRLDHPRHKDECAKTVAALKCAAPLGRAYAHGIFKSTLNIGDRQFAALWNKHGTK